jgi:hypothetical protein
MVTIEKKLKHVIRVEMDSETNVIPDIIVSYAEPRDWSARQVRFYPYTVLRVFVHLVTV